ncbi:uncharacterized protein LOC131945897 [Physella acuta]|uniref:uncharacterized protein LOC131945897 n=1 Tax=Physella acuta TaxID=109671 RepID=UPI0027DDE196|nr:uncharacterized protein LOC131945897 [Physella acuta]
MKLKINFPTWRKRPIHLPLKQLRPRTNLLSFSITWFAAMLLLYSRNTSRRDLLPPRPVDVYFQPVDHHKDHQACVHPQLNLNDPVMAKLVTEFPPLVCKGRENLVTVYNGSVHFTAHLLSRQGTCDYYPISRVGDYNVTLAPPILDIKDGFQIPSDFSRIVCKVNGIKVYDGIHAGAAVTSGRVQRKEVPLENGFQGLSIAVLGFDSMSRMSWMRRLKKTREYFHKTLMAIELEGHNIVGDGTTAVMFPMLTGKFEWELPECRRNFPRATTLDYFPFIWHEMKRAGYLTSWANAAPHSAPFNYRMLGFKHPPTDFYTRPFYLMAQNVTRKTFQECFGSRTFSRVWFDYFLDIFSVYKDKRKFLFHFLVDMSHDDNNKITKLDDDLRDTVQQLHAGGHLNTTLLILMGDHGARYSEARGTWSGKLEERLPYVALLLPDWFQQRYPQAVDNLRANSKRLTTPFDLHETFKDFLRFRGSGKGDKTKRGISLFREIPLDRSCDDAGIAPHWCACLAWEKVSVYEEGAQTALQAALDKINTFTAPYRSRCALLSILDVTSASKLQTRKEVLKFSKTDADGGIYKIDFGAAHQSGVTIYQLTFHTAPGGGHFEATVTHDALSGVFTVNEKEISRINKYGDAPACILNENRQIRQYCYCKSQLLS